MRERRLELRVGLFLASAVAGLVLLLLLMGELRTFEGAAVSVDFSHTGGLVKGAPVKLGGIEVGKIGKLELLPTRRDSRGDPLPVCAHLALEPAVRESLHADARITVATQGPLGEAYLELHPGSAEAPPLANPAQLRGMDAPRLELLASRMGTLLEAASRVLEEDPRALSRLAEGTSGLSHSVFGLIAELSQAASDLRKLTATAQSHLDDKGHAAAMLRDGAALAHNLRTDYPKLTERASALAGTGEQLAALTQRLDAVVDRTDRLMRRLEAGEGTAGAMLKDKQLYEDLRALLSDLRAHPWKLFWKQ